VITSKSRSRQRQAGIHYTKSRLKVAMDKDVLAWTTLLRTKIATLLPPL